LLRAAPAPDVRHRRVKRGRDRFFAGGVAGRYPGEFQRLADPPVAVFPIKIGRFTTSQRGVAEPAASMEQK